ncbi:MAG: gliding motility-associated C-terminal domain-containing protein [Taibaiella sp.]|nr:gliding motility-associated C-terminal domain-containing protein [Taibaiella sp.]
MTRTITTITLVILLFCPFISGAQNYLSEGFDGSTFPPSGWSVNTPYGSSDGGGCGCTDWTTAAPYGGAEPVIDCHNSSAGMAWYNSWDLYYGESTLITPGIDFTTYSGGSNTLSFYMYRSADPYWSYGNEYDYIDVYVNTTNSLSGATFLTEIHDGINQSPTVSSEGWYQYTITLPNSLSTSSSVYVLFDANSAYAVDMYLEDVSMDHIPDAPTITGSSTVCSGSTLSLTASDVESGLSYSWTGPGGFTASTATINISNATASNAGTYTVVAYSGVDSSPATTINVSVNTTPDITSISSNSPVCESTTLTFNITNTAVAGTTYRWIGPNGFNSTTQNPTISNAPVAATGRYYVYDTSAAGCYSSDSIDANVIGKPVISSTLATPPTTCNSTDGGVKLFGLAPSTTYTVTYSRNGAAPASTTLTTDILGSLALSGLNTGNYNIYVTSPLGCASSAVSTAVSSPLSPAAPTASNSSPACENTAVNLFASSASSGVTYQWNGPNGFSSTTQNPLLPSVTLADGGTYYVSTTDGAGCISVPATTTVTVKPLPLAPTASSNTPVCQGATLLLNASSNTAGVTYSWTGPNSFVSTAQNPSITNVQLNAIGTYTVYSVLNGCNSATPGTTNVYIKWTPGTPTASSNSPTCTGLGNSINLFATDTSAGVSYNWNGPAGTFTTQNPVIPNPTASYAGNYTVYVTLNGCNSATNTTNVIVNPTPAPPVPTPTQVIYCQYQPTVALTATGSNLLWYAAPSIPTSTAGGSTTAPVPNDSTAGFKVWYVTQTLNGCQSLYATDTVIVKTKPQPPFSVDSNYIYCQGDAATILGVVGVNTLWYPTPTGGVGSSIPPKPSTNSAGVFTYYATQTVNGCESDRFRITVTVKVKPAPPAVNPVIYCQGATAIPLSAGGANLLWFTTSGGGVGSPVAPTPITSYADTFYYYVSQTVNGCQSDRAKLPVIINYTPNALIVASQPFVCQHDTMSFTYFGNAKPDASYDWSLPQGASVISGGGQGPLVVRFDSFGRQNVLLIVTNHGCHSASVYYTVDVHRSPIIPIVIKNDVCQDEVANVSLGYANEHVDKYVWNFDGADVVYGASGGGPYGLRWHIPGPKVVQLIAYTSDCPSLPERDTVNVHPLADAHIGTVSNNNVCAGDSINFTAENYNAANLYQWMPAVYFGDQTNLGQVHGFIGQSGYVKLMVTTQFGCTSVDSTLIMAQPCCDMYFPNAFTPNGDGKNDFFRPITQGAQQIKSFRVTSRWGQVVYETVDVHAGWDGKMNGVAQDLGTYFYYIKYVCANGKTYEQKGELILLR